MPDSAQDELIAKASRFLDDPEVRQASPEAKAQFLQSKGLTDEQIRSVMEGNSSESHDATDPDKSVSVESIDSDQRSHGLESQSDEVSSSSLGSKDAPPIITYPEFLFHSQKPEPLVTRTRLLQALYVSAGTIATMYGVQNFVVQPMLESLSAARHSFFETASTNIDGLNEKLQAVVSKIPETSGGDIPNETAMDLESEHSSPTTRFFSRSTATQTSPSLSRSSSSISMPLPEVEKPVPAAEQHVASLSRLQKLLESVRTIDDEPAAKPLAHNVDTFADYLRDLPMLGKTGRIKSDTVRGTIDVDGITKVKTEIKGVKGALLSAKNFPSRALAR